MNVIEKKYQDAKREYSAEDWDEYEIAGGKVCLKSDGLEAIVMTDGRYPTLEEGYQFNDYITETETVLWGAAIIELPDEEKIISCLVGDSYSFKPKQKFSISGKCVCLVRMDQKWESSQKHYISA